MLPLLPHPHPLSPSQSLRCTDPQQLSPAPKTQLEGTHQGPSPLEGRPGSGMGGTAGESGGHSHTLCTAHRCSHAHTRTQVAGGRAEGSPGGMRPSPHLVQFGFYLHDICLYLIDGRPATGTRQLGSACIQPPARVFTSQKGLQWLMAHLPPIPLRRVRKWRLGEEANAMGGGNSIGTQVWLTL